LGDAGTGKVAAGFQSGRSNQLGFHSFLPFNLRRRGYPAIVSLPPAFLGAFIGTPLASRAIAAVFR
jgi:hypothetical protein